jgi:hypothetical protein
MKREHNLLLLSSLYYFHHDVAYHTYTAIGRLVEWNVKIEQIIIIIKKERGEAFTPINLPRSCIHHIPSPPNHDGTFSSSRGGRGCIIVLQCRGG